MTQFLHQRYRLEEELGSGGMGIVYRGYDERLDRPVAIKVLNTNDLSAAGQARLLNEARAAARLNHPNIVAVYDAEETNGQSFIVMELVAGKNLRLAPPEGMEQTLNIARQICSALEHAHAQGIIHRDLKPDNILLTASNTVKLMDFGLARAINAPKTAPQNTDEDQPNDAVVGTLAYLAPELIIGAQATPQSDLYAFGILFYEMLTGRPPFEGCEMMRVLNDHLHTPVTPPNQLNAAIPDDINLLALRLLAKDPADRPASAADVQRVLAREDTISVTRLLANLGGAPPHNLPAHLSIFVGRQHELEQLNRRLEQSRLVTLTGSGGVGKTRLALQAASELLPVYPQGIWLVELAPLSDPALVIQAVARTLGVRDAPSRLLLDTLTEALRQKSALIILDNCEHVIDACASLTQHLLEHCPNLHLLATSREPLGIEGEVALRVPSLSLPPSEHVTPASLAESEAVQLFIARAAEALPSFTITETNASAIAQVCRRLDGIALAIELAASRVKVLKVGQIAARLDDAFRLLTGGSRTALPRQQTLRATIDWSYNLLSEPERRLLNRLAVFAGGWTLEAAEAIVSDPPGAAPGLLVEEILDLLIHLVDKSLIVVERQDNKETRYRLLETIRQYAREKLSESRDSLDTRDRHCRWFTEFAEHSEPELRGQRQPEWLEKLAAEHDNLRAALGWALERQDAENLLRLSGALQTFWKIRSFFYEGIQWLEAALALADQAAIPATGTLVPATGTLVPALSPLRARALQARGSISWYLDDLETLERLCRQALQIYQALDDQPNIALCLNNLASVPLSRGNLPAARQLYQQSMEICQRLGPAGASGIATCLHGMADIAGIEGDIPTSAQLLEQTIDLLRQVGSPWRLLNALGDLAWLAWIQGQVERARPLFAELLEGYQKLASHWGLTLARENLFLLSILQGDYTAAHMHIEAALANALEMGDKVTIARIFHRLGDLAYLQGRIPQARTRYEESLKLYQESRHKHAAGWLLGKLGGIAYRQAQYTLAADLLQQSQELTQEGSLTFEDIFTPLTQGNVMRQQNQLAQSMQYCRRSLEISRRFLPYAPNCLEGLAKTLALCGQPVPAARLYGAAHTLRQKMGAPLPPIEEPDYDRGLYTLRTALDENAFLAAWHAGADLSASAAIDEALQLIAPPQAG